MSPCTLLKEILRLVPCTTEIILDDECNVKLYHDVLEIYDENNYYE